jgi:hypothetical protein
MPPKRARSKCHVGASVDAVVQVLLKFLPAAYLQELRCQDTEGNIFGGNIKEVAARHQELLSALVELDPFITKSLLLKALQNYTATLGFTEEEEWYRRQVYDLRQSLSQLRMKAHRVKTGARQPSCMNDLLKTFHKRRLLRRRSSAPTTDTGSQPSHLQCVLPSPPSGASGQHPNPTSPQRARSKTQIWALYGQRPPAGVASKDVVDLCSSEDGEDELEVSSIRSGGDLEATQAAPAAQSGDHPTQPHYDAHLNLVVRTSANGKLEKALTEKGPDGFLVGTFPDGTTFVTDVPNLVLLPVIAKPKQKPKQKSKQKPKQKPKQKRKSKAKKKAQAKTPTDAKHQGKTQTKRSTPDVKEGEGKEPHHQGGPSYMIIEAKDKTYIVAKIGSSTKWEHLISVYESQTGDHCNIVHQIFAALPLTKDQAIQMRKQLLENT